MNSKTFRIGTRGSPLALKQANMLSEALKAAHQGLNVEIVSIKSAADWKKGDQEKPLSEAEGGKGLFAKEIEAAILNGDVDCGVHSMKDMAAFLPDGLEISHVLPRADMRDAFISHKYKSIDDLPEGAIIGTCSVRRQALTLLKRGDLTIVPFRGNIQTRLDKVKEGQVDATFLAMAGLERLGIESDMIHPIAIEEMLPACAQGVVCMEIRADDSIAREILDAVHCSETGLCAMAEREVLKILDGSCHTPIGAYAKLEGGNLILKAIVASLDGQQIFEDQTTVENCVEVGEAIAAGREVGEQLSKIVPKEILS